MRTILPAFADFPKEGEIIGRLVAGYGELEFDLGLAVGWMTQNREVAMKVIFRAAGENQRILMADALVRPTLKVGKVRTIFEKTIAAMHTCRKIRNQYAHSNWMPREGVLTFFDLQPMAAEHAPYFDGNLRPYPITIPTLEQQEDYFCYVSDCLTWLNFEGQLKAGKVPSNPVTQVPKERPEPPMHS
ncbi:MAG TPA: hypothetical protein VGH86_11215 [Phenylobacterium sp.]|jgi:hypothetical protein